MKKKSIKDFAGNNGAQMNRNRRRYYYALQVLEKAMYDLQCASMDMGESYEGPPIAMSEGKL